MTDFAEILHQCYVKLSLALNVIETDRFFLQKVGVSKIELVTNNGPTSIGKCKKVEPIEGKFPTTFKYGSSLNDCTCSKMLYQMRNSHHHIPEAKCAYSLNVISVWSKSTLCIVTEGCLLLVLTT